MIHLSNEETLRKSINSNKGRIVDQFKGTDILSKAIPMDEFNDKYPVDKFDRYASTEISKFKDDFMKSEDADEDSLNETLKGLSPVFVKEDEKATVVYVKAKAVSEE